jgi:hypothetical protein
MVGKRPLLHGLMVGLSADSYQRGEGIAACTSHSPSHQAVSQRSAELVFHNLQAAKRPDTKMYRDVIRICWKTSVNEEYKVLVSIWSKLDSSARLLRPHITTLGVEKSHGDCSQLTSSTTLLVTYPQASSVSGLAMDIKIKTPQTRIATKHKMPSNREKALLTKACQSLCQSCS